MALGSGDRALAAGGPDQPLEPFDRAIFEELQRDGRVPFTALGEKLGISEAQVRRRVKKLTDADVLSIVPIANPRFLGIDQLALLGLVVRGPDLAEISGQLLTMPQVNFVVLTSGEFNLLAEVGCASSDELYRLLVGLRRMRGIESTETFVYLNVLQQKYQWALDAEQASAHQGVIERSVEIDDQDAAIIGELQRDGRASFRDIGKRVGLSERTVSGRFTRLVEVQALQVIGVGNPVHLGFPVLAWAGITLEGDADLERVARLLGRIPDIDYIVAPTGRYDLLCELVCRSSDELLAQLGERVGAIDGISHVDTFISLRMLYKSTAGAWGAGRALTVDKASRGSADASLEPAYVRKKRVSRVS
jgi:Lrp/AsnC family transcriptional regulator for asnA, asnC and gidA